MNAENGWRWPLPVRIVMYVLWLPGLAFAGHLLWWLPWVIGGAALAACFKHFVLGGGGPGE